MKNIAIIPARSGSKGLKDKNILELNGNPLLAYSIIAAQESGLFDEIMVSTDSEIYAEIAKKWGASVPFLRSTENSTDKAGSWDVVKEVLINYKSLGKEYDTVTLLQPTSPLRTKEDIINAFETLENTSSDAVTSVCETDHSPLWCMTLDESRSLIEFRKNMADCPRQQLCTYYRFNGAIYIRRISYNDNDIQILSNTETAYIMDRKHSIDIDTEIDFRIAECFMNL